MLVETEQVQETEEVVEPSKETEAVSEEAVTEEVTTFKTKDELEKFIREKAAPLAQGMKDKELKPTYDKIQSLEATIQDLNYKLEDKSVGDGLSKLEAAELAEHGNTQEVRDVQEERRIVIQQTYANKREGDRLKSLKAEVDKKEHDMIAFEKAYGFFLDDEELQSKVKALSEKLKGATPTEMDLHLALERATRVTAEVKPKRPKPDSSISSAPGGNSHLTGEAALLEGLAREKKKLNL